MMNDRSLQFRMAASLVLMGSVFGVSGALLIGKPAPLWVLLSGVGAFFLGLYLFGYQMVIRQVNARQIPREEAPNLFRLVDRAAEDIGVETPDVLVGDFGSPNAFAIGRPNKGSIVVSETLVELLEPDELAAILTHETVHIASRDVLIVPVCQSPGLFAGYLQHLVSDRVTNETARKVINGVVMLLSIPGFIFTRPFAHYREFYADRMASEIINSDALIRALDKMANSHAYAPPETTPSLRAFFAYNTPTDLPETIVSSHPPIQKRIDRLKEMGG